MTARREENFHARISMILDGAAVIRAYLADPGIRLVGVDSSLTSEDVESDAALQALADTADPVVMNAVSVLAARLDSVNEEVARRLESVRCGDLRLEHLPVERVGLYVPRRNIASIVTWASAARAAGVADLVVYLPVDPTERRPTPEAIATCLRYRAKIRVGPARYGFPTLAFGVSGQPGADILCGPAGARLNALKQLCSSVAGCRADMYAGPSDIAVVVLEEQSLGAAMNDVIAQLEHGPDSHASVIAVGRDLNVQAAIAFAGLDRCTILAASTDDEAVLTVDSLAPETAEVLGPAERAGRIAGAISNAGVAYANLSSSLGDYMAVGRGCGDPTGGAARSHSGVSPWTFLRHRAHVDGAPPSEDLVHAALSLATWEGLPAHYAAIAAARI